MPCRNSTGSPLPPERKWVSMSATVKNLSVGALTIIFPFRKIGHEVKRRTDPDMFCQIKLTGHLDKSDLRTDRLFYPLYVRLLAQNYLRKSNMSFIKDLSDEVAQLLIKLDEIPLVEK